MKLLEMKISIFTRTVTIALLIYSCTTPVNAQFDWVGNLGGSGIDDGRDMVVDIAGNSYVAGEFNSPDATFGSFMLVGKGNVAQPDVFVSKYNTNGVAQWAIAFQGNKQDQATAIDLDAQSNVYVTGMFRDSIMIGSTPFVTTLPNSGNGFIAKLDDNGNFIWAQHITGTASNSILDIAVHDNGDFYICGTFTGTVTHGGISFTATGNLENTYLAKYNSNGQFLWFDQQFGTLGGGQNSLQHVSEVAISPDGLKVYTAGWFLGTVTWGGVGGTMVSRLGDQRNPFLASYDSTGNVSWVKRFGAYQLPSFNSEVGINDLAVKSNGDPILVVQFAGGIIFNDVDSVETDPTVTGTWHYESFLVSHDAAGTYQWRSIIIGDDAEVVDLAIDGSDNLYFTGSVDGNVDFGAVQLTQQVGSIFVVKFNGSGTALSSVTASIIGNPEKAEIAVDPSGNMFISGSYFSAASFPPHNITATGFGSVYLAKIDAGSIGINEASAVLPLGVFPNPASGRIWFGDFNYDKNQNLEVSIFDIAGKMVLSYNVTPDQLGEGLMVESLSPGHYSLTLSNGSAYHQSRFIIE